MSLTRILDKIKHRADPELIGFSESGEVENSSILKRFFLSMVIILVALLSFGIGRLTSARSASEPVKLEYSPASAIDAVQSAQNGAYVVASSKGGKYYYPNCSGVSRISDANKVTFPTAEAAEASGYSLASGCNP